MSEATNLLNTLRVRLKEIFDLERRLRELLARLRDAEFPGTAHAETHLEGGVDEIDVTDLGGFPGGGTTFLRDDGTFAAATTGPHATSHQNGGGDEINVGGLSGVLADPQTVDTDAAGALDGDGSVGSPLAVRVDGSTIIVNGSNELEVVSSGVGSPAPSTETHRAIVFVIDGGGVTITTGIKGDISVPFDCVIVGVRLLADQNGAIVIDIWKDVFANYPPDNSDSITASAPPTIASSNDSSEDTTLTGWNTGKNISAGDTLRYNVDSVTSLTRVAVVLDVVTA